MRTDVLGLQLRRVVEGQQHRGYCAIDEGGWQGKHDGNVDCQDVQDERERSWTMKIF